jgi:hypothetical protein
MQPHEWQGEDSEMASVREVVRAMGLNIVAELARQGRLQEAEQEPPG